MRDENRSGNSGNGPRAQDAQKAISRIWEQKYPKIMRLFQKTKNRQRTGIRKTTPQKKDRSETQTMCKACVFFTRLRNNTLQK
jgi:hypothetical protein